MADYTGGLPNSSLFGKYIPSLGMSDSGKETVATKAQRIAGELFKPSKSISTAPAGPSLFTPAGYKTTTNTPQTSNQGQGSYGAGGSVSGDTSSLFQKGITTDINPDFSAAINSLNKLQESLKSQLPGQETQLTNEAAVQKQQVEAERARRQAELESQTARESGRTEQNVAEQRRIASELAQGLQSRFGATTGTGQFASELLGRESMTGIANSRQAFSDTMRQISDETNKVMSTVQNQLFEIDKNLENSKIAARNQLSQRLAEIDAQKGQLESRKSEMKFDMLKQFALINADIEARNTSFKQELYKQAQTISQRNQEIMNMASPEFVANLKAAGILGDTFQGATQNFQSGGSNIRYAPQASLDIDKELFGVPSNAIGQ